MKKMFFSLTGLILVLSIILAACGKAETPASNAASGSAASSNNMKAAEASAAADKWTGTLEGQNEMKAAGTVDIENGQLKLSEFSVSEGPDLHVYLAKGDDVGNGTEVGKVDLNSADQTFDVNKVDLANYDTVLIYCQKAHVIFGKAALQS